ncbi:ATP synthase F1 subunit gamma [Anoxynatronum sibiricum]|uniref:ATP synthase gamma chain n=1 Tax=Anoxynatronum sibiricum TaxID=210623 RepID=A0ABU9VWP2_9CLOT
MAGLGMRDIKRRIKSVKSTRQITKAMEMVASAKLRKTRGRLEESRPFTRAWKQAVLGFLGELQGTEHPLVTPRETINKTGYIVIAGNRGLCGGYNTNVVKQAWEHMQEKKATCVVAVGQKSWDYFSRREVEVPRSYLGLAEVPDFIDAQEIRRFCLEKYQAEEVDEIYLVYTHFESTISYKPKVLKLMPLDEEALETCFHTDKSLMEEEQMRREAAAKDDWELAIYEPSDAEVLGRVVPSYLDSMIYGGLMESAVSEQAARRVAMESATSNAEDMIDKLQLQYNRARQAAITQEIAEIVGGAEALK